jgi:hypothetical protein
METSPALLKPALAATLFGVLVALLAAVALAQPWQFRLDIGGLYDYPYLRDFHAAEYSREHQTDFRWSRPDAALVVPGVGPLSPITLRLHGDAPGQTIHLDAGHGPTRIALRPGWHNIALLPRPAAGSGDVLVRIVAPPQQSAADPRERGVVVDTVALQGRGGYGAVPPGQALLVGVSSALAALLAGWVWRRWWVALVGGAALAGGCIGVLVAHGGAWRPLLTVYTGRMVLVLAGGGVLAVGVVWLLRLLHRRGVVSTAPHVRRWLAAAAVLSFLLRFGGMAYPLTFMSDIRFTMARATMVREGQLLKLFLPNPSLTPLQWETEATVPRSPFYYILTAPLTALPGHADRLAMMAFSSAIDALALVCVALLLLLAGRSGRTALLAALLAAVMPLGLELLVSWGLFPTLLAQCLVVLAMVVWLVVYPHLHRRRARVVLCAALTLAAVAYPTALLFLGTTWVLLVVVLAVRRDAATRPTLWAGMMAAALALLLFYGWHIPASLDTTLPMLTARLDQSAGGGGSGSGAGGVSLLALVRVVWEPLRAKYGLLVLGLAAGGAVLLFGAPPRSTPRTLPLHMLLLAWGFTYVPMALASAYVVTFILKDVLYLLPLLALLGGVLLAALARRRVGVLVVAALVALVAWEGLLLELHAIVYGFAQLK